MAVTARRRDAAVPMRAVLAAIAAIGIAEACVVYVGVAVGVALHAVLLLALLNWHVLSRRAPEDDGPAAPGWEVPVCLALVPLLRILSVTMAVRDVAELYDFVLIGAPVLLATLLAARLVGQGRSHSWFEWSGEQAAIALSGIPLGVLVHLIAPPDPFPDARTWTTVVLGPFVLAVFVGLSEELMFRGLLQRALVDLAGTAGVALSGILYAIAYMGVRPLDYVALIVVVGVAFGLLVERTGSLVGVTVAHALLLIGTALVWPEVIG